MTDLCSDASVRRSTRGLRSGDVWKILDEDVSGCHRPGYRLTNARAAGNGGVAAPARPARLRLPDCEGGSCAHRDAEDVRPAAGRARGTAIQWRDAARQTAP